MQTIRPMMAADIAAIVAIEKDNHFDPWNAQIFADCLRVGYHCVVLILDEVVIGYAISMLVIDELHLLNITVAQAYQQQGKGRYLMEYLLSFAKQQKIKRFDLEVRASNTAARHLYEVLDFKQVGMRKAYYVTPQGREDAILYTLMLDS